MHRRHPGSARLVAVVFVIAVAWLLPGRAAAQGETATPLDVGAILCRDVDCLDHTDLVPGFAISALDSASGDVLATCTTDEAAPHLCTLSLPAGADWTLAWDDAQVPAGYAWRGDLSHVADGPLGTATLIPLVPVQGPAPVATTPPIVTEPGHVTVQAALCPDASCREITAFLDLFIISAVDPDTGEEFSSCATGNLQQGLDRQCILDVPADGDFALAWIPDQVPQGYAPLGEPFQLGDPAVLTLGFYRATDHVPVTPAPAITALPSTGAGPDAPGIGLPAWLTLTLAGTFALGGAATRLAPAAIRRHDGR